MQNNITEFGWFMKFSEILAAFNKAYIKTRGKGLIPHLFFNGNDEEVKYCLQKEADLFFKAGIFNTNEIYGDDDVNKIGIHYIENYTDERKQYYLDMARNGNLLVYNSLPNKDSIFVNFFSVRSCMDYDDVRILGNLIPLNSKKDVLEKIIENHPDWHDYPTDIVTNRVLICHFMKFDDDILHEEDFSWMNPVNSTSPSNTESKKSNLVSNHNSEQEIVVTSSSDNARSSVLNSESSKEEPSEYKNLNESDTAPAKSESSIRSENKEDDKEIITTKEDNPDSPISKDEELNDDIPAPEVTVQKKYKKNTECISITKKEILTQEESDKNYDLVNELFDKYNEVRSYIFNLHDPSYRTIINHLKDAVDTYNFNYQFCREYMDFSNDYSTEAYRLLYELDEATKKFLKTYVKYEIPLGCVNCGYTWEVDGTFMRDGIHPAECPKCHSERQFERKLTI